MADEEQRLKIEIETEHFIQLVKPKMIVDQLGYLSELLYRRDCDKSVNYEKCRIDKVKTLNTIINTLGTEGDLFHIPAHKLFEYINFLFPSIRIFINHFFAFINKLNIMFLSFNFKFNQINFFINFFT